MELCPINGDKFAAYYMAPNNVIGELGVCHNPLQHILGVTNNSGVGRNDVILIEYFAQHWKASDAVFVRLQIMKWLAF